MNAILTSPLLYVATSLMMALIAPVMFRLSHEHSSRRILGFLCLILSVTSACQAIIGHEQFWKSVGRKVNIGSTAAMGTFGLFETTVIAIALISLGISLQNLNK